MDKIRDKPHQDCKSTTHFNPPPTPPPMNSPPSNTTSPTHEFSFTISLQPTSAAALDKSKAAVDLSPADEIFFHGHLLPLHLLSNLPPISPRTSTNSLDSLTLPVKSAPVKNGSGHIHERTKSKSFSYGHPQRNNVIDSMDRPIKAKSFSFMSIPRWRKDQREQIIMMNERKNRSRPTQNQNQKKRSRFDIGHVVKRYIRMVRPLFLSLRGRREKSQLRQQPYSFSGNLVPGSRKNSGVGRGRRDTSSAPASMRTSPGNSGLLVQTPCTSTSDSTMEELQAAIQAAIAHCKNSISTSTEEKIKAT